MSADFGNPMYTSDKLDEGHTGSMIVGKRRKNSVDLTSAVVLSCRTISSSISSSMGPGSIHSVGAGTFVSSARRGRFTCLSIAL